MRPVLLIGHDDWETFGVAPHSLERAGVPWIEHLSHRGAPLPGVDEVSAIVLFGGVMNVDETDAHPFLASERELVRRAVDAGVPYLGICLGAQMLARVLDHPVVPAGVREIGFHPVHPTPQAREDPLMSVFEDGDAVFHWHQDTFPLPAGATQLATGADVPVQAYRIGAAWGLQFHLEVDRAELELWLKTAGEDVVNEWGSTTERLRADADRLIDDHERRGLEVFGRFWKVAAGSD